MLIPKIKAYISNNCKSLIIKDVTGIYNVTSNVGGYGGSNIIVSNIISSTINIITPNTSYQINNPVGLPTDDINFEYNTSVIPLPISDGIYIIEYILTDDNDIIYTTGQKYFVFTCNIRCCVQKMFRDITKLKCDCNNPLVKNALYAQALLDGLDANVNCGNITIVNEILIKLNQICGFTSQDCGCK